MFNILCQPHSPLNKPYVCSPVVPVVRGQDPVPDSLGLTHLRGTQGHVSSYLTQAVWFGAVSATPSTHPARGQALLVPEASEACCAPALPASSARPVLMPSFLLACLVLLSCGNHTGPGRDGGATEGKQVRKRLWRLLDERSGECCPPGKMVTFLALLPLHCQHNFAPSIKNSSGFQAAWSMGPGKQLPTCPRATQVPTSSGRGCCQVCHPSDPPLQVIPAAHPCLCPEGFSPVSGGTWELASTSMCPRHQPGSQCQHVPWDKVLMGALPGSESWSPSS